MKIIAELCQNHNGNTDIMLKMVEDAAKAGATHVKLQHIFANNLSYRSEFENGYIDNNGVVRCIKRPYQTEYDRLKPLELSDVVISKFINECNNQGVVPMTTCFAKEHCQSLWDIGFRNIKVASYDCASFQLLRDLKRYNWDITVSTGATFDAEIKKACSILDGKDFDLLHCITIYPTPLNALNLLRMNFLKNYCRSVGFSDHTKTETNGIFPSIIAIYLGADVIERHFTILDPSETRDGPVSINYNQLRQLKEFSAMDMKEKEHYVKNNIQEYGQMLGNETRELTHEELLNRMYYRGRFASRNPEKPDPSNMIFNWEEV